MEPLEVGESLYKYQCKGNFAEYTVVAIINRESGQEYEVECQSCLHGGENCHVIIKAKEGKDYYIYKESVNDPTGYKYIGFHHTPSYSEAKDAYYTNINDSKIACLKWAIKQGEKKIKKWQGFIKKRKERIEEAREDLSILSTKKGVS